jgi:hypothetical protein
MSVCPSGYYCAGGAKEPCPAGRFSALTGTVSVAACEACSAGTFSTVSAATNSSTCEPCPPLENSSAGSVQCWPGVVAATASNPPPLMVGFSVGDVITIVFTSDTNTPTISAANLQFTPSIGVTEASWRSPRQLSVRVVDTLGIETAAVDVAVGALQVTVVGLKSASMLSAPSPGTAVVVGGTWGAPSPPEILRATAVDSGANVGFDTGDSLVLVFDQAVAPVDVSSTEAVLNLLAFTPSLPGAGLVRCVGQWTNGTTVLRLEFSFGGPAATRPWLASNVGVLAVRVQTSAGLTSNNRESLPSNSSVVVGDGSWGDAPVVHVVSASARSLEVSLSPPTTSFNSPVRMYIVQWSTDPAFGTTPTMPTSVTDAQALIEQAQFSVPLMVIDAVSATAVQVGTVGILRSGNSSAAGVAIALLGPGAVARRPTVFFTVPGLAPLLTYTLRCVCNSVGNSLSPLVPTAPPTVTPQLPLVTGFRVPGGVLSTSGGTVVDVAGERLGGLTSLLQMRLSNGEFSFTSSHCEVTLSSAVARCYAPAGVGFGHRLTLIVDDVASAPYPNATLAYAPPAVRGLHVLHSTSLDTTAGGTVDTTGGSAVLLVGQQFGPAALSQRSLGAVTYSPGSLLVGGTAVKFTARNCTIQRDDVEILCTLGPGVGSGLLWTVVIAGQVSVLPRTGYRPPVIHSLGVAPNAAWDAPANFTDSVRASLSTAGGEALVFVGNYFGPKASHIPVMAVGRQLQGRGAVVSTTACVVSGGGHSEVRCISPQGTGAGFTWSLHVGGQASAPTSELTSYAAPVVVAVATSGLGTSLDDPGAVPTAGGATVTLYGLHFGAAPAVISVAWDGVPITDIALRSAHTVVSFISPRGQGHPALLALTVDGQATSVVTLASGDSVRSLPMQVPFRAPLITSVTLDRSDALAITLDCSSVQADGASDVGSALGRAVLVIQGANFGNGSEIAVVVRSSPCVLLPGRASDSLLACETSLCNGRCAAL